MHTASDAALNPCALFASPCLVLPRAWSPTELQPYIVGAFPLPFNWTFLNWTVPIDTTAFFTRVVSLIMSEEYMMVTHDLPPRKDGTLFPQDLVNLTLPGAVALYTQLVTGGCP
jgi:hypothetical protein